MPFRDELLHAVVINIVANAEGISEEEIKPIISIDVSEEVLSPCQLEAIVLAAEYFYLHAHKALSLFLPAPYLRQALKKWGTSSHISQTALETSEQKIELITPAQGADIAQYIESLAAKNQSAYIIFSFEKNARETYNTLPKELQENILFIEEDIPEVKEFRVREAILQGKYQFIFGSRRTLLYNTGNYEHIVYTEDALAKTFMRSFHTLPYIFFLESFAKSGKKITVFSQFPRVSDFLAIKRNTWTFTPFP